MALLTLHNLPDQLLRVLDERARQHGRTVEEEAVDCLRSVLPESAGVAGEAALLEEIRAFRNSLGGIYLTEDDAQRFKREGRP